MSHSPAGAPRTSCPHCGAPVSSPFCTSCGRAVEIAAPAPTLTRTPTPAPLFAPAPVTRQPYVEAPRVQAPSVAAAPSSVGGRGGRTLLVRALVAFVVLIATGIGGVFGYQWWRDRPATQALEAADAAVSAVTDPLGRGHDPRRRQRSGVAAPAAAKKVAAALAALSDDDTTLTERVRPVLQSQQAFLESVAPFEGLGDESLTVWGSSLPAVQESLTELVVRASVAGRLRRRAPPDRGQRPPALDRPRRRGGRLLGQPRACAVQLDELLVELHKVRTTREAAVLGERAVPLADAAAAAEAGQEGTDLDVARLARRRTRRDRRARRHGSRDAAALGSPRAPTDGGHRRARLSSEDAAESMSTWVSQAQKKMDAWRAEYDRAESVRSSATSQLDTYAASVRRTLRQYDRARDATADALETAELDAYSSSYDVEYAMEEGVLTRRDLLDDLQSLSVPPALVSTHGGLEAVLGSGVEAMRTGEQAVEDWNLCYLRLRGDLPRHQRLAGVLDPLGRDQRRVRPGAQGVEHGSEPGPVPGQRGAAAGDAEGLRPLSRRARRG